MAITPRTIFTSPATAAVAAASLFAMTAAGVALFSMSCPSQRAYERPCHYEEFAQEDLNPCDQAAELNNPAEHAQWSEYQWFNHANCFAQLNDSESAINAASQGIKYYPSSEALFNLKGYHLINLKRHTEAVKTLKLGLSRIGDPVHGTLENNLAWSGLWVPRELDLYQARALYRNALSKDSKSCEVIHTGLWVEYAVAKQSQGLERAQALRTFSALRENYAPCQGRYDDGNRDQMLEVLGAVVAFEDIDRELRENALLGHVPNLATKQLAQGVGNEIRRTEKGKTVQELCAESIPLATAHHTCVDIVEGLVRDDRRRERAAHHGQVKIRRHRHHHRH